MFIFIVILLLIPSLLILLDAVRYIFSGKRFVLINNLYFDYVVMVGLPLFFLIAMDEGKNECCYDTATFSPDHKLSIYALVFVCVSAYFYSRYRKALGPPVLEVFANALLLAGIVFNIFIAIHAEQPLWIFGNLPVVGVLVIRLMENQKLVIQRAQEYDATGDSFFVRLSWKILTMHPLLKMPLLLLLSLPVLVIFSAVLLLFGQKPDSLIRAFTDTYRHGLSQWDYQCEGVYCEEHFLCTVAAKGHPMLVKPERLGERGGNKIVCNRQLLIANAFEELLQQRLPAFHKFVRRNYNKVGKGIHRYYNFFNNKVIADLIYILMKPLEWVFLLTLYTFSSKPEDRIARQYLSAKDRKGIACTDHKL